MLFRYNATIKSTFFWLYLVEKLLVSSRKQVQWISWSWNRGCWSFHQAVPMRRCATRCKLYYFVCLRVDLTASIDRWMSKVRIQPELLHFLPELTLRSKEPAEIFERAAEEGCLQFSCRGLRFADSFMYRIHYPRLIPTSHKNLIYTHVWLTAQTPFFSFPVWSIKRCTLTWWYRSTVIFQGQYPLWSYWKGTNLFSVQNILYNQVQWFKKGPKNKPSWCYDVRFWMASFARSLARLRRTWKTRAPRTLWMSSIVRPSPAKWVRPKNVYAAGWQEKSDRKLFLQTSL